MNFESNKIYKNRNGLYYVLSQNDIYLLYIGPDGKNHGILKEFIHNWEITDFDIDEIQFRLMHV